MQLPREPSRNFPYHIEEKIGEGSMGAVYLARETNLDRKTAIKVLRSKVLDELSDEAARNLSRRFLQEARASAKINHPGVVTVHRLGSVEGRSFIAMEWLEGQSLRERIDRESPLSEDEARRVAGGLLETLEAAHSREIVHRDIKPSNVMLEPEGRVVLTDFGIAHVRNSELVQTQAGSILGTPVYASPEQLLDDPIDARSDLYAVGVVLFEMLTGELPHDGDTVASLVAKRLDQAPPEASTLNPAVSAELEAVVGRALSRDVSDRFDSAAAMRAALETGIVPNDEDDGAASLRETAPAEGLTRPEQPDQPPIAVVEGDSPVELAVRTARNWPADPIGKRPTQQLLDKLLDTPLHAEPFAGAAQLGDVLVLIYQGLVYAGIDLDSGAVDDTVLEELPETAPVTLFPIPERFDSRLVPHLASILHDPERLHEDLDSSFTDLPQLVERLEEKGFDGAVRLESNGELGFLIVDRGERILDLFSCGWRPNPADRPWRSWIGERPVTAHVERRRTSLPSLTYRRELRDLSLEVTPASEGEEVDESSSGSHLGMRHSTWIVRPDDSETAVDGRDSTIWRDLYRSDPHYRLLMWLLEDLPAYLEERSRFRAWKYLSTWVEQIQQARLYHDLRRPDVEGSDFFGLVTADANGKVLHLARRTPRMRVEDLDGFVADVRAAKKARIDRGDIGGAILAATEFEEGVFERYREIVGGEDRSWLLDLQDSMTGYDGFVRMGSRRGFHLMLVRQDGDDLEPKLPPSE